MKMAEKKWSVNEKKWPCEGETEKAIFITKLEEIQELKANVMEEKLLQDNGAEQRRGMGNTVRKKPMEMEVNNVQRERKEKEKEEEQLRQDEENKR